MPWCPKCKNEYVDGVDRCVDCDCELVESLEDTSTFPLIFGEKEQMEQIKEFLVYNHLTSAVMSYDDKEEVYELYVSTEEEKKARKAVGIYLQQEAERRKEKIEYEEAEEEERREVTGKVYVKSSQRAEENRSSAYTLLFVGIAGTVVLILIMMGIIPLQLYGNTKYMIGAVMEALFLLFIVMGILSFRSSKQLAKRAESENSLTESMKKWCEGALEREALDAQIMEQDEELTEEMKYFRRTELLKEKIKHQFMNLDEDFLEHFIDDIYETIFES